MLRTYHFIVQRQCLDEKNTGSNMTSNNYVEILCMYSNIIVHRQR